MAPQVVMWVVRENVKWSLPAPPICQSSQCRSHAHFDNWQPQVHQGTKGLAGLVALLTSFLLFLPPVATMSLSLPLVRKVVFGETLFILVSVCHRLDVPVVRHNQCLRFDRSRPRSIYPGPKSDLPGLLFHLFRPQCLHCDHSLVFRRCCVSFVPSVRLPKSHFTLPRLIIGTLRDGAFTSRISYQVGWLSYLAIMWLATGAQTASTLSIFVRCDIACVYFPPLPILKSNNVL